MSRWVRTSGSKGGWLVAHNNNVKGWKKSADFSIVPGSWMTVVLFQLFGLPCLFCARLCTSCLDDLKIFYYEQKLRFTQHPHTNTDNRASDLLTMQTQSETAYNWLSLAIQAEMYTAKHTQHTCMVQSSCVLVDEKIYAPNKKNYVSNLPITWLVDTKHTWALLISFAGLWRTSKK